MVDYRCARSVILPVCSLISRCRFLGACGQGSSMWSSLPSRRGRPWIFPVVLVSVLFHGADCHPGRTGSQAESPALIQGHRREATSKTRVQRAAAEESYWSYSGTYGPDEGWASAYPGCREKNQSPINIIDQETKISTQYQELTLEGFSRESSNKTSMKNTGKTVAIMLKDDFFVRGAGLPGRFKAEKVEFHWGPSNGSEGSEHSVNGRRYPVEMQIYMYNSDDFDSLNAALREKRIIAAMAVFFQVEVKDNPAVDPIIHGLRGVVHHEKETFLEPFVLQDLLPASLGSYYRYTGSLTTPPCSKVVEWIVFSQPIYVSYKQLEAFYSIFTTEQQDHVKSVEYLRSNFRPIQSLGSRHVFKSAITDAWMPHMTDGSSSPYGTEASKVCSSAPTNMKVQHVNSSSLLVRWTRPDVTYHPPILHFLVSYSWTSHEDSYEETHVTDAKHKLEAIISPVSPDVLYLFRVQAVCLNDMRSDFSQTTLFRANTTRIFEGTRIVKTGMPTVPPASSADMAPISSGSSTWTSSGLPFSFVSMATGMGPSSSGSQASVASVLTSTLLAGLGFSGGVISSFPSSIWPITVSRRDASSTHQSADPGGPIRVSRHNAGSAHQSANPGGPITDCSRDINPPTENREADRETGEDQREDGEKEDEEEEEEEKKERKGSAESCEEQDAADYQSRVKRSLLTLRDSTYTDYINYMDSKPEQYLLTENTAGNTIVMMKSTTVHTCCTVYQFTLCNNRVRKEIKWSPKGPARDHFSPWSDMGFPHSMLPVITSVHRSSAAHIGPVSVHFSSGQSLRTMSIEHNDMLQQDIDQSTADGHVILEEMHSRHSVTLTHSTPQHLGDLEWRGNRLSNSVNRFKVLLCQFGTKTNVVVFLDIPCAPSMPTHRLTGPRPWRSAASVPQLRKELLYFVEHHPSPADDTF